VSKCLSIEKVLKAAGVFSAKETIDYFQTAIVQMQQTKWKRCVSINLKCCEGDNNMEAVIKSISAEADLLWNFLT